MQNKDNFKKCLNQEKTEGNQQAEVFLRFFEISLENCFKVI